MGGGQLDERAAARLGERHAARVLEVGDRVERHGPSGAPGGDHLGQGVDVEAPSVDRHAGHPGAVAGEQLAGAIVGGGLDQHLGRVAAVEEVGGEQVEDLERAVAHEHVVGVGSVALGEPGAQLGVAGVAAQRRVLEELT